MPNECKYQPCSAEYEIHNEICKNRLACGRQFKRGTTYNHFLGPNTCSHCCYISSSYHYNQWRKETLKYAFATKCQNHQAGLEPDGGQKPFVSCKNLSVVRQIWPNQWKPNGADFSPYFCSAFYYGFIAPHRQKSVGNWNLSNMRYNENNAFHGIILVG